MKFSNIPGGVTAARGFRAAGVIAGIKEGNTSKKDVAIILSERAAAAAGVFTTNKACAACIPWDRAIVAGGSAQAVVVNSGNANACTGKGGTDDVEETAKAAAEALVLYPKAVLVSSTGVIGVRLNMPALLSGVKAAAAALADTPEAGTDAAMAIMTTDTVKKEVALEFAIDGVPVRLGGMAKGSGMIHPNMATMLAYLTTDAAISPAALQRALAEAADLSFNMITVDGDTSTNDSFVALANGMAGNPEILPDSPQYAIFAEALRTAAITLAKKMAKDGEGANKLVEVRVLGARSDADAKTLARSVAASSLVKAAMFGNDANWGRIICALGYAPAEFDPGKTDIAICHAGEVEYMMKDGAGLAFDEEKALAILQHDEVGILVDLHEGVSEATAWGCDLSYDYVRINADYRT